MYYPNIDPIIVSLGPLAIRWYGLAYLLGFGACWLLGNWRAQRPSLRQPGDVWSADDVSDVVFYGAVGGVLGGRIGYSLFYAFERVLEDPLFLVRIWDGGMSIHGGMLGSLIGLWLFARRTDRNLWSVTDFILPMAPIGLGLGRLGNFANTELPGRATESAFGMIYPCSADAIRAINPLCTGQWETFARHPSPLYQAFAEGVVLFALMWWFAAKPRSLGHVTGVFLLGYGALRVVTEYFRQPDSHLGFVAFDWLTMGQSLSIPLVIAGILLLTLYPKKES